MVHTDGGLQFLSEEFQRVLHSRVSSTAHQHAIANPTARLKAESAVKIDNASFKEVPILGWHC